MKTQINEEFKAEFLEAREMYLIARAMNEANLEIDFKAKKAVLKMYPFMNIETGKRILDSISAYMMSDQAFKDKYMPLLHEKSKELGLKNAKLDYTADYESRPLLDKAEKNFLEIGFRMLPKELADQLRGGLYLLDMKEKIIDLMCRFEADKMPSGKEILLKYTGVKQ
jgi:hypothetical protein